jgi:hypothetical protein
MAKFNNSQLWLKSQRQNGANTMPDWMLEVIYGLEEPDDDNDNDDIVA